jgi:hypothetical protein
MPKGSPVICSRTRETMILGDVPTSVMRPPSSEANDIGIRNTDGEVLDFLAILSAAGINMARAPMFFTIAESNPTEEMRTVSCHRTCVITVTSRASAFSTMPDLDTAALTTSAHLRR